MCPACNQEKVVKMVESDDFAIVLCGCAVSSRCIPQFKPQQVFEFRNKVDKIMLTCNS